MGRYVLQQGDAYYQRHTLTKSGRIKTTYWTSVKSLAHVFGTRLIAAACQAWLHRDCGILTRIVNVKKLDDP